MENRVSAKPGVILVSASLMALSLGAAAQGGKAEGGDSRQVVINAVQTYSPPARHRNMTRLFWGDTHLHTAASADAYTLDGTLSREEAYRFARGEVVTADNGMPVQLKRPLDFLAVTDHAEYLGVFPKLKANDPAVTEGWPLGRQWADYFKAGEPVKVGNGWANVVMSNDPEKRPPERINKSIWAEVAESADRNYRPGVFTTFSGYEWTSMITGDNLHRVVLFKDSKDKVTQVVPFSAQESTDPEQLWQALERYEAKTGGEVLAIPHNGNVSNGRMFAPTTLSGKPLDRDYASKRMRWEPVTEVTQVKGTSEAHPKLSPEDEFADFEIWDEGNILLSAKKKPEMLPYEYARSALREGLRHEQKIGVNPFKFGMIGSTDIHNGLSSTSEDNFLGKFGEDEPRAGRMEAKMAHFLQENWQLGASGLAAVWATENTREAIFAAIKRKEVYGTTGSRLQVRFFGGWDFGKQDVTRPDYAEIGYRKGVPMGGELGLAKGKAAPTFMVTAARDPDGANLDRIQIIKGWLDAKGETHEKIFNVALSGGRKVDKRTGKAPPVGNTVNVEDASYTNDIGAAELSAVWADPGFDPGQKAFYYARVLEIPTPRWTAYDVKYFKTKLPERAPKVVQDRAYTSPIWYTP